MSVWGTSAPGRGDSQGKGPEAGCAIHASPLCLSVLESCPLATHTQMGPPSPDKVDLVFPPLCSGQPARAVLSYMDTSGMWLLKLKYKLRVNSIKNSVPQSH